MKCSFGTIVRLILGLMFLVAGVMKITDPVGFFSDLLSYRVAFPEIFLRMVAVGLPWLEVITGLGLILNFWPETIRPIVAVPCLIFVLMLGQAVIRGIDLNCGCFGSGGRNWFERPDVALVRAGFLLAASLYLAVAPSTPPVDTVP